jgi:hypothetical protein
MTLAIVGFVLCDAAALLALGNVLSFWSIDTTWLGGALAVGVVCLIVSLVWRR